MRRQRASSSLLAFRRGIEANRAGRGDEFEPSVVGLRHRTDRSFRGTDNVLREILLKR
jgi:hypothetical protein